ncbi:uncharacterized protein [Rutidosis leptorrhynchoides]|uniref:uncharacterized protein n=1 Tax=Rutidosis leptorrhynchoides TaxID=125765 RepID=UPI003A9A3A3F
MMNISRKKLLIIRFLINPNFLKPPINPNPLIISPPASFSHSSIHTSTYNNTNLQFAENHTENLDKNPNFQKTPNLVSQLIDVIKSSKGNCRSQLDLIDTKLSKVSVCEILRVLSCEKVLSVSFFEWVRDRNRELYRNGDVCSLVIDNCGWVGDYDTMTALLTLFKQEKITINNKAFGFLPVLDSSTAHAKEKIALVVDVLNKVGGSVCNSGVFALIDMLCGIDCFDLAKYVIELTEKKSSYYAILVREKCKRGDLDYAYALLNEMRTVGCEVDCKIYNYILGCLCKSDKLSEAMSLLEQMQESGIQPDEITFEIFIASACRLGKMDFANERLRSLMDTGSNPRVSTHVAIVKGYFNAGRYDEAYEYARDMEVKNMPAISKIYSVLARLHQSKGNVEVATRIFNEMMEKGLKPDFLYYKKTVNTLSRNGGRGLAQDLRMKYSKFRFE